MLSTSLTALRFFFGTGLGRAGENDGRDDNDGYRLDEDIFLSPLIKQLMKKI